MEEMRNRYVLMIWDMNDAVFTKFALPIKSDMQFKHRGRKPNRMIVPEDINTEKTVKLAKENIAYNGLVVTTGGDVLFDGRRAMEKRAVKSYIGIK